jgi:hypothetical protein
MATKRGARVVPALAGLLIVLAGLYGLALTTFVFGQFPSPTTTAKICTQPDTVTYETGAAYEVVIKKPSFSWGLSPKRPHAVIGRSGNNGTYGVFVDLTTLNPAHTTRRWEPDRVEIIEPNGIVHSIPASFFTGGR